MIGLYYWQCITYIQCFSECNSLSNARRYSRCILWLYIRHRQFSDFTYKIEITLRNSSILLHNRRTIKSWIIETNLYNTDSDSVHSWFKNLEFKTTDSKLSWTFVFKSIERQAWKSWCWYTSFDFFLAFTISFVCFWNSWPNIPSFAFTKLYLGNTGTVMKLLL